LQQCRKDICKGTDSGKLMCRIKATEHITRRSAEQRIAARGLTGQEDKGRHRSAGVQCSKATGHRADSQQCREEDGVHEQRSVSQAAAAMYVSPSGSSAEEIGHGTATENHFL
jgi:hypothetical protein